MKVRKGKKEGVSREFVAAIAIIFVLLLLVVMFAKPSLNSSIIFLYPDGCTRCDAIEPEVKEAALKSGMRFYKMEYVVEGPAPVLIFIHNSTAFISGYKDADSLKKQVCGFTGLKRACGLAGEDWQ